MEYSELYPWRVQDNNFEHNELVLSPWTLVGALSSETVNSNSNPYSVNGVLVTVHRVYVFYSYYDSSEHTYAINAPIDNNGVVGGFSLPVEIPGEFLFDRWAKYNNSIITYNFIKGEPVWATIYDVDKDGFIDFENHRESLGVGPDCGVQNPGIPDKTNPGSHKTYRLENTVLTTRPVMRVYSGGNLVSLIEHPESIGTTTSSSRCHCIGYQIARTANAVYISCHTYFFKGSGYSIIGPFSYCRLFALPLNEDGSIRGVVTGERMFNPTYFYGRSEESHGASRYSFITSSRIYNVVNIESRENGDISVNMVWAPFSGGRNSYFHAEPEWRHPLLEIRGTGRVRHMALGRYNLPLRMSGTGQTSRPRIGHGLFNMPFRIQGTARKYARHIGNGLFNMPFRIQGTARKYARHIGNGRYTLPGFRVRGQGRIDDNDWILRFKREEVL